MTDAPGRWATWHVEVAPCCGESCIHVYPTYLTHIECECGAWIETPGYGPEGAPIPERGRVPN